MSTPASDVGIPRSHIAQLRKSVVNYRANSEKRLSTPTLQTIVNYENLKKRLVNYHEGVLTRDMSNWQPMETAPTRTQVGTPTIRVLLKAASGRVDIGWHDPDTYAKKPRPYWYLEGRFMRVLDMRADQPVGWMPLPEA